MMKNIKMTIEYDGTRYKGWQAQPSLSTVQNEIENYIMVITKERVRVNSAGRTDAGAHALRMTANFFIESQVEPGKLKNSLNALLPGDIAVVDMEYTDESFHARKSATKKIYEYRILNRDAKSPFLKDYCWHVLKPIDIVKMSRASQYLIGEHDFAGFTSVGTDVKSHVRTIFDIKIIKKEDNITLTFIGSGFLKQMVRNIVGLLVQIGLGKFEEDFVKSVLRGGKKEKAYMTAPAKGLFLKDVLY